jgi:hypothetical protein
VAVNVPVVGVNETAGMRLGVVVYVLVFMAVIMCMFVVVMVVAKGG